MSRHVDKKILFFAIPNTLILVQTCYQLINQDQSPIFL